jgi:hypothetical protein
MVLKQFLQMEAPAHQARRYFWTKFVVVHLWIATLIAIAAIFENWFRAHPFVAVVTAISGFVSVIAVGLHGGSTFLAHAAGGI